MSGLLHFEDFHEGQRIALGPYTVERDAIIAFATDFDPQAFHLDDAAAKAGIFGALSASGWHTCGMIMRMLCDACLLRAAVLGSPGVDSIKWKKPVLVGDILSGECVITGARKSTSRPGVGILNYVTSVHDQYDTPKAEIVGPFFIRTRP
jgi:acyl dehydratase